MKLKKKNRERLEDWYIETNIDYLFACGMQDFAEFCRYGFKGAMEFTDAELLEEYKRYAYDSGEGSML